ncbi:DUF3696 domain-containing protein [Elizabethkingia meningoseptica]|uniref:DUF3696 domain-containing protein n=1 Tax=Elizabethkingia meningoseptica TaxID=238 RepID=UPI002012AF28|nr:DUF3696 domain-containing protein [Elizabethkingia meningoseptica]MCL1674306.1 DUF3696 domain-containing protein [Elizabethkingia meningoseptica]MCL1686073.1 DUF3696 domain-containing protein [Elizabethkingia meningoseptica]
MQKIQFNISGFKCFIKESFTLKNVTLLTGSNGTGKSSFIQALLLIRRAIEKNSVDSQNENFVNKSWKNIPIALNGPFELNLGSIFDVFNEDENIITNEINISLNQEEFKISFPESDEESDLAFIVGSNYLSTEVPFWRKKEFYYLNTERLGPRLGIDSIYTEFLHCNYKGENTGKILFKYSLKKVNTTDQRFNQSVKGENLQQQVDAWLEEICPGTLGVQAKDQGPNRYQIIMKSSGARKNILAPNIGFGISYALPIIVNGLIAEPGSAFIVENPEAHLHPKGQSNMGYFLGMVAASGVRLIIETHSEHIVNGVRRASLSQESMHPDDIGIYFFEESMGKREITINNTGDLESFPKDFFDQVGQDMAKLFSLKNKRKNG